MASNYWLRSFIRISLRYRRGYNINTGRQRHRLYSMPKRMILITGGARSGKSRYAQELALQYSGQPLYVATARAWDDEFRLRIRMHQQDRDERWRSMEEQRHLSRLPLQGEVAVIDCVTLWITN